VLENPSERWAIIRSGAGKHRVEKTDENAVYDLARKLSGNREQLVTHAESEARAKEIAERLTKVTRG